MFKLKSIIASGLISILSVFPAQAYWESVQVPGLYNGFKISTNEIVETPENEKVYAYIEYGVITKIVIWGANSHNSYVTHYVPASLMSSYLPEDVVFMAELPSSLKVGTEAINHGDFVTVSDTVTATEDAIPVPAKTQVISSAVAVDYHTSITVAPLVNNDPNKQIGVEVISNGMAVTAVTTDNTSTPITFNQLPSNEYVTVQTKVTDKTTGEVEVFQEAPVLTPNSNIPVVANSRDIIQDRATIASPQNQVVVNGDTKSVTVSFDSIANWDPSKTSVSIEVVGPGGATTSIGVGGDGGSVTVDNLGAVLGYTVKMVIRDLATSQETIVLGSNL